MHLASSNVSAEQLETAAAVAEARSFARFVATQIEWNLLARGAETQVVPAARRMGVGIVPYFPLASGMLTGKYRRGEEFPEGSRFAFMSHFASVANDDNFDRVEALAEFAEARGHPVLELAVAWLAAQEGVGSVICGATTPEQVRAERGGRGLAAHRGGSRRSSGVSTRARRIAESRFQSRSCTSLTGRKPTRA